MPAHSLELPSLSVGPGIESHVLSLFSRNEVNRIWLSEPWLSFHYFWMKEKHLNGGNGRGWHKLGNWNSGNNRLAIYRYLQSVMAPTPALLPGKSHGRRSLVGCTPLGCKESDTTEWLYFHFSLSWIEEGNGNPLQYSCLENPRDGGAWWAAVYWVAQSRTQLKWLSSSSSSTRWQSNAQNSPR